MNIMDKNVHVSGESDADEDEDTISLVNIVPGQPKTRKINISLERLAAKGMITPTHANSKISEEYRLIKLPLLRNAFGQGPTEIENGNLIMVTSSQPGEGKTFTAINLAISMSMELDKKVLLVDADVARPAVSKTLAIESNEGLVDVLLNPHMELSEAILRTNISNLSILTCGRSYGRATELLASDAMRNLAHELSRRYPDRIVIFDSPPLLASSEATVLSNLAGQIVMVVEAYRTQQHVLSEALGLVDSEKVIGLVLNKSRSPKGTDYYGSYHYHS